MAYQKKKTGSKQEIAYGFIKNAIINNEYEPNSMLVEGQLSEQLGISKTPVREALRRLSVEKFVEFIPEKGTFVSRTTLEDMIEIFDVREALEGMAARICALRRNADFLAQLEACFTETYQDLIEGDSLSAVKADLAFHHLIINGSRNQNLVSFSRTIMDQVSRYASTTVNDPERLKMSYNEHREILVAIAAGTADLAESKMREHIRSVKSYQINTHYINR